MRSPLSPRLVSVTLPLPDLFNAVCRYNGQNGGIFRAGLERQWPNGHVFWPLKAALAKILTEFHLQPLAYSGHSWGKGELGDWDPYERRIVFRRTHRGGQERR